jgi:hypothetical protein
MRRYHGSPKRDKLPVGRQAAKTAWEPKIRILVGKSASVLDPAARKD